MHLRGAVSLNAARVWGVWAPVSALALGLAVLPAPARCEVPPSFAAVVEAVAPAVVTIESPLARESARHELEALEDDLDAGGSLGSGVIIDPKGVVLTNAHVARAAEVIEVVTMDGRRYRPARVAVDMRSDLAVLIIGDGTGVFPHARLGDSDRVRVGDWVLAIGAPVGLETTVTSGIVSSRARESMGPDVPDYLLTSAVMRSGNSGGPLVSADGTVVGIATIFAFHTAGLAFTIPSNTARAVVPQLLESGRVLRPSLGVITQSLTPELARALGTGIATGLLVADVLPGGPAALAGVRSGDVLLALDAHRLLARTDLLRALRPARPGQTVSLRVRRHEGGERAVTVRIGAEGDEPATSLTSLRLPELGCEVRSLTPELGIVVSRVDRRAEASGLRAGDIVRQVNHSPVRTLGELAGVADRGRAGDAVALLVQRGRVAVYVGLVAAAAAPGTPPAAARRAAPAPVDHAQMR